ncbi:MAG: hypothetical protein WCO56_04230 [Verrucomicrobiota bacterium]
MTLAASTQLSSTEDHAQRFAAYGWHPRPSRRAMTWRPSVAPSA